VAVVISLANQKGGVAKTTTCANLGAGLGLRGVRTLLVDFDPQASLSHFLGIPQNDPAMPTISDLLSGQRPADEIIQTTPFQNLSILPAGRELEGADNMMRKDPANMFRFLQHRVDALRDRYDAILIDTLPSFSLLFANSLAACDYVIIPAKLDFLSMQGVGALLEKVREVHQRIRPIKGVGIVGTFFRKGVRECENCLQELRGAGVGEVFDAVINLNSRVAESPGHTKPIQYYDRSSQGSQDYEKLTQEVIEACQINQGAAVASAS